MKPVIMFVAAFVVATAASTGAKLAMSKPAAPAKAGADSAKHDTLAVKDSTRERAAPVAETPTPVKRTDSATTSVPSIERRVDSAVTKVAETKVEPPVIPSAPKLPTINDTVVQASERRIAKVFTSMEAKQAAKVLEHMTDNDVHVILGYVGPRQAASIMAELPPERVATLAKIAMQGKAK